ncbi:hypothetical protein C8R44DRAFT_868665 [Mycena epipterygia]|nr:hypothetical protein C8R44DRAFT_868665 [Mycena epipterygia]
MAPPKIKTLSEDVLLYLLTFCDISSVLALSQTCKYFHLLSRDQHLWVALIENLTVRLFRDPLPGEDLRTLGTPALVGLAMRAVRGSEIWVDAAPALAPVLIRELRVPCAVFTRANFFNGRAELLPGGRYLVVTHRARVMLLDAANEGAVVALHETQQGAHIHAFHALVEECSDAVAVVLHTETFTAPRKKGLEIMRFSLGTQDFAAAPVALYAHRYAFHDGFWCDPQICGDYASIVIFDKPTWRLLLIDWVAQLYMLVDLPQRPNMTLIPGHLVLATHTATSILLSVFEIHSLRQHWRPITDNWAFTVFNPPLLSALTPLLSDDIPLDPTTVPKSPALRVSVYESPLERNRFSIHIHVWNLPNTTPQPPARCQLFWRRGPQKSLHTASRFTFSLTLPSPPASRHVWMRCSPVVLSLPACFPDFQYAGSSVLLGESQGTPTAPISLPVLVGRGHVRIGKYSGALTLVLPGKSAHMAEWAAIVFVGDIDFP